MARLKLNKPFLKLQRPYCKVCSSQATLVSGCEYTVLKAACSRRYSHDGKRAFAKTWNLVVQHMTLGFLVDGVLIRHNCRMLHIAESPAED